MQCPRQLTGVAVLALTAGALRCAVAQPDPSIIGKAANPTTRPARVKANRVRLKGAQLNEARLAATGPRLAEREIAQLEAMFGQKLTDAQRKAVTESTVERYKAMLAAQQKHRENVAAALGITAEDLALKQQAYLKLHPGGAAGGNAALDRKLLRGNLK